MLFDTYFNPYSTITIYFKEFVTSFRVGTVVYLEIFFHPDFEKSSNPRAPRLRFHQGRLPDDPGFAGQGHLQPEGIPI